MKLFNTCHSIRWGFLLWFTLAQCSPLLATTPQENAELARINQLLSALYPLITTAQLQASKPARQQFNYAALRRDIQRIQAGIAQAINQAPLDPRPVPPLINDFLQTMTAHISPACTMASAGSASCR